MSSYAPSTSVFYKMILSVSSISFYLKILYIDLKERDRNSEREREQEEEGETGSLMSKEPDVGSIPRPWDNDLR